MASTSCTDCPELVVRKWSKGHSTIQSSLATVEDIVKIKEINYSFLSLECDVAIIFAQANEVRRCSKCRRLLSKGLSIPECWWEDYCHKSNGYFGREDSTDEQGETIGISTWSRFLVKQLESLQGQPVQYDWLKLNTFTRWLPSQTVVILFDLPPLLAEATASKLLDKIDLKQLNDPFWPYPPLVEELIILQDRAIWNMRDLVRAAETSRDNPSSDTPQQQQPSLDFPRLHDLSRHAIHITETLEVAVNTIDDVLESHLGRAVAMLPEDNAANTNIGSSERQDVAGLSLSASSIRNRLLFHRHITRSLLRRSQANKERLRNEIDLAFNIVAQRDARVSVEIGRAAQADGAAMKAIAFVTLTFLPATFVCALFSMSFFDFTPPHAAELGSDSVSGEGSWSVSDKIWIYWAVTVPLTVCTTLISSWWNRISQQRPIGGGGNSGLKMDQRVEVGAGGLAQGGTLVAGKMDFVLGVLRLRKAKGQLNSASVLSA